MDLGAHGPDGLFALSCFGKTFRVKPCIWLQRTQTPRQAGLIATGIGGVLLIVFTHAMGFSVRYISLAIILLVSGWIFMVVKVKEEYINK